MGTTMKEHRDFGVIPSGHVANDNNGHKGYGNTPEHAQAALEQAQRHGVESSEHKSVTGIITDSSTPSSGGSSSGGSSGGCFLTTACTQAAGLPDDCDELTTLRQFRDTFVRGLDKGEELIQEYYANSPMIVQKLSGAELETIYEKVRDITAQIGAGKFREAFDAYTAMFTELRAKHLELAS